MNGTPSISLFPSHKRVLTIDGGGFYGVSTLLFLDAVVSAASKRLGTQVPLKPYELFDIISGTSGGALIAILLARYKMSCQQALEAYDRLCFRLFGGDENDFWRRVIGRAQFDPQSYKDDVTRVFNDELFVESSDGTRRAKVLVYVASDAPTYDNRIYAVRSYDPPSGGLPAPVNQQQWSSTTAATTIISGHYFVRPRTVDGKLAFRDASFSGCMNPTESALEEVKALWPDDEIGVVVSIGSPLQEILNGAGGKSTLSAKRACVRIAAKEIGERLTGVDTLSKQEIGDRAKALADELMMLAGEAQETHNRMETKQDIGPYFRIIPRMDLSSTALVDRIALKTAIDFTAIKNPVERWLQEDETQALVGQIAEKLVHDGKGIAPPVPSNVNKNYNPVLDQPRPESLTEYLESYHVLFIIDDSGSMNKEGRWEETRDALTEIVDHAEKKKTKTIDIKFLNDKSRNSLGVQVSISLNSALQNSGRTPTGTVLNEILKDHIAKLNVAIDKPEYRTIAPLDIIVLTDGIPDDEPSEVIKESVTQLRTSWHHPNCVGIQFVQIGNDPGAQPALEKLKYGQVGDIVDSVPYDGKLTPERLNRILLGGLHPSVRSVISALRA
ncbi:hypothetical protein AX16_008953 [Volvariella volvacea WC 439]|nr:hypothetical protein AX16_008953 [Volvariella volvacea WC 439]